MIGIKPSEDADKRPADTIGEHFGPFADRLLATPDLRPGRTLQRTIPRSPPR
jgi:hypothetical protein